MKKRLLDWGQHNDLAPLMAKLEEIRLSGAKAPKRSKANRLRASRQRMNCEFLIVCCGGVILSRDTIKGGEGAGLATVSLVLRRRQSYWLTSHSLARIHVSN